MVSQSKMWYFGGETSWKMKITGFWVVTQSNYLLCVAVNCDLLPNRKNIHHKHLKRSV